MVEAALAEALLSLFTARERAAAVAGDLVEEAPRRGRVWFCVSLLGVALALFASAFGARRGRVLWLFASGFVLWLGAYTAVRAAGAAAGLQPLVLPAGAVAEMPWSLQAYLALSLVLSGLAAGAVLGRRARVHGVNGAAPLAAFWASAALIAPLVDLAVGTATWHCTLLYVLGLPLFYVLPLLAGGALGARSRVAARPTV